MANLTLRSVKGSPLTNAELDGNFEYFTGSHAITGSLVVTGGITGSLLGTATTSITSSYVLNGTLAGTTQISGSILISGSLIPNVSGSATSSFSLGSATNAWKDIYVSNGTINFLNGAGQIQSSLGAGTSGTSISGSLVISGSTTSTGGFTGSLLGTASVSTTSSYAATASVLLGGVISSSYAATASVLLGSVVSSSYAATASVLLGSVVSASYAVTASYINQPYKIYKALLSLSGGGFTTSIIENTIGNISWSNPSNGVFYASLTGAFVSLNVGVTTPILDANGSLYFVTGQRANNNLVQLLIYDLTGSPLGSTPYFDNFLVEIIVN